jgi:hypothetical protein
MLYVNYSGRNIYTSFRHLGTQLIHFFDRGTQLIHIPLTATLVLRLAVIGAKAYCHYSIGIWHAKLQIYCYYQKRVNGNRHFSGDSHTDLKFGCMSIDRPPHVLRKVAVTLQCNFP